MRSAIRRVVDVKPGELRAMLTSFAYFFFVLSSWFVLRPIRDAVAAASGASKLSWMFAGTLTVTLLCNPLFSSLVVRFPSRRFVPFTYHFFAVNLAAFYVLLKVVAPTEGTTVDVWVGRAFFVWTSVFNMFVVSVFWCFMADVFRSEQAKRLFGFIGLGGTLGTVAGSSATAVLASRIGTANLVIVSIVLLELAVFAVSRFPADTGVHRTPEERAAETRPIGGSVWSGLTNLVRSPYLAGIATFLVLYTVGSTVLYFAQSDIVGREYPDRASRTTVLAQIELAAQTLTIVCQAFFTGRIIRWVGLGVALALLPLVSIVGFTALAFAPVFMTLAVFTVIRRGANFALTNPSMEALFTVVSREDKYKAKSLIETFVYRGGDQLSAWFYAGLSALGLTLVGISFATVPLAAVWLMLGVWLGRRQAVLAGDSGPAKMVLPYPEPVSEAGVG
jgi:AAA family ATP:ADP antiporter